jgi:hypothetical protein
VCDNTVAQGLRLKLSPQGQSLAQVSTRVTRVCSHENMPYWWFKQAGMCLKKYMCVWSAGCKPARLVTDRPF